AVCGPFWFSARTGDGLDAIKAALNAEIVQRKLHLKRVPSVYAALEAALNQMRMKGRNFITLSELYVLADRCRIPAVDAIAAAGFLHNAGSVMFLAQAHKLQSLVVLQPQWLSERMADLISFKCNWANGYIPWNSLQIVFRSYAEQIESIIDIL